MAAALEFAGNDVKIELGEDGHSNRHGASILPDTLRWLWRDYPQPITVKEPAARRGTRNLCAARAALVDIVRRLRQTVPPPAAAAPPAGRGSGPRARSTR